MVISTTATLQRWDYFLHYSLTFYPPDHHSSAELWSYLWPSSGLTPASPSPFYTEDLKLGRSMPGGLYEGRVKGKNHIPPPAGHISFGVAQDVIGFLGCKCTLPVHAEHFVHHHTQGFHLKATVNQFSAHTLFVLGIALTHIQDT